MLTAYAPKLGIVAKEIRELGALLDQVNVRKTGDLLAEVRHTDQLAENESGIVEAQRLAEVAGDEVVAGRRPAGGHVESIPPPVGCRDDAMRRSPGILGRFGCRGGPICCFGGHPPNDSARFPG